MEKGTFARAWCAVALVLGACTGIDASRKKDTLVVHSFPEGASFTTDTGESGTTPAVVPKERGKVMHVHFEMPGYASQEVAVHSSADGRMFGTFLLADLCKVLQPDSPRPVTADNGSVMVAMERGVPGVEKASETAPVPSVDATNRVH
jgi:hypothetical protein